MGDEHGKAALRGDAERLGGKHDARALGVVDDVEHAAETGERRKHLGCKRRGRAVGVHAHGRSVHDEARAGVPLEQRLVGVLAVARDDVSPGSRVLECAEHGPARAAGAQDQHLLVSQPVGAAEVGFAEAAQQPGEAEEVGVVAHDPVAPAHERVDRAEALGLRGQIVDEGHDVSLVGDGDVEPLPAALAHVGAQLVGLELNELVGPRAKPLVDLRTPAVAECAT